jgi:hypothetical protein
MFKTYVVQHTAVKNQNFIITKYGYVGIGTTDPVAPFDILTYESTDELDQVQDLEDGNQLTTNQWQSFTAGVTGVMTKIQLGLGTPYSGTVYIREGEGTGGSIISSKSVSIGAGWRTADINDCDVIAGQQYTIHLSGHSHWYYKTGDPYSGGRSSSASDRDFMFKTHVAEKNRHMVVTDNGNVGINKVNPENALHVDGAINLDPITAPPNPSSGFVIYCDSTDGKLYAKSSSGTATVIASP